MGRETAEERSKRLAREYLTLRTAQGHVNRVRGDFLAVMIELEERIDDTVLKYFQPDEATQFVEWVLPGLSFNQKLGVLRSILKHLDLWQTHRERWTEIDRLRLERNQFAHSGLRFVDNSFLDQDSNYRLTRHHSAKITQPSSATSLRMVEIQNMVVRAQEAFQGYFDLALDVEARHEEPAETFWRAGNDSF
jgi:hypothetical protein